MRLVGCVYSAFFPLAIAFGRFACSQSEVDKQSNGFEKVFQDVEPSTVMIVTESSNPRYFDSGLGTGLILNAAGDIVTAGHVVRGKNVTYKAVYSDGTESLLAMITEIEAMDLAFLRPNHKAHATIPPKLRDLKTDPLRVGERVCTIGAPYGLAGSITSGIVSAIGRTRSETKLNIAHFDDALGMIQTDAILHPGNSGGPLLDARGRLVGIVIAASGTTRRIGFALPVDALLRATDKLTE